MAMSKLELKVRRLEQQLQLALGDVYIAQAALKDARDTMEKSEGRMFRAREELKEEQERKVNADG